jgi:hypothetical protein
MGGKLPFSPRRKIFHHREHGDHREKLLGENLFHRGERHFTTENTEITEKSF